MPGSNGTAAIMIHILFYCFLFVRRDISKDNPLNIKVIEKTHSIKNNSRKSVFFFYILLSKLLIRLRTFIKMSNCGNIFLEILCYFGQFEKLLFIDYIGLCEKRENDSVEEQLHVKSYQTYRKTRLITKNNEIKICIFFSFYVLNG